MNLDDQDTKLLSEELEQLKNLSCLEIDLSICRLGVDGILHLFNGINKLPYLDKLNVDLSNN